MVNTIGDYNIETLPFPVFVEDLLNNIIHCNIEFEKLFGSNKKDIIGFNSKLFISPDDNEIYNNYNIELIKSKQTQVFTCHLISNQQGPIKVIFNKSFLKNSNGNIVGIMCVCFNAEINSEIANSLNNNINKLFRSELKYENLIDDINEGVFILKQGYIISISQKLCEILNLKNCDLLGMPFWYLSQSANKEIFIKKFINYIDEKIEKPFNFNYSFDNNTKKYIEFQLKIQNNNTVYGIARDISDTILLQQTENTNQNRIEILSSFTTSILNISYPEDVFDIIGKTVKSIVGNAIVFINIYDKDKGIVATKHVYGLHLGLNKVLKILGLNKPEIQLKKDTELYNIFMKGTLYNNHGIPFFVNNNKNAVRKWNVLKKILNIESMYIVGFKIGIDLFGGLAIYTKNDNSKIDFNLLESIISLANIAIKRWFSERDNYLSIIQYTSITDNISEGVYTIKNNKFSYVNNRFLKLFKYSNLEVIGKEFTLVINFKNKIYFEELLHEKIIKKDFAPIITECVDKENNVFIAEITLSTPDNGVTLYGIVRNITDRLKSEERSKNISIAITQSGNQIMIVRKNGIIDYVNEKYIELSGFSEKELIGKTIEEFNYEINYESYNQINSGIAWHGEILKHSKNSNTYWVSLSISAVKDSKNNLTHYLYTEEDITEKKLLREKIAKENLVNEQLAKISKFILTPGVCIDEIAGNVFDAALIITNAKIGFVSTIDKYSNDNICHTLDKINGNLNIEIKTKVFKSMLDDTKEIRYGHCFKKKDAYYENNTIIPIVNNHIKIENFLSVPAKNEICIYGQIALANKTEGFNDEDLSNIQKLADIYTFAIIRKQIEFDLIDAKIKAEESDILKSVFLANMSHEIRTPLNNIVGFSNLLKRENLNNEKKISYTNIIKSNSNQLLNLINDILDISKINSNQLNLFYNDIDLDKLFDDLYQSISLELNNNSENQIQLKYVIEIPESERIIYTDELRLKQILNNLLNNAVKFTKSGKIVFSCNVINENNIEFCVSDTGIGVSLENQKKIFDRFRQEDENLTRKYSGAGLGLAISKGLVDLFNGKIWLKSEKGKGSSFYFSIPLLKKNNITKKYIDNEYVENIKWENNNILIVDDNKDVHNYYNALLTQLNLNCIHIYFGSDAIELFKIDNNIDLVLMDLQLLDISGLEATKEIKKLNPNIPIIAQTAFAMQTDREKALNSGCDEYISKPIDEQKLIELLKKFLNKKNN